ncbi:MAG: MATE family efflux transporter [Clostridia bacterium]|nr:MATE family efflux transporter [Clostridia bacterium]
MDRFRSAEEEAQYRRMTQTPVPRLVTSIALPATAGMLVSVIYNTADTYFVSQISPSASAAVGAVFAIMAAIQALGYGIGMGASSLISRRLGAKKTEEAHRFASGAFLAALLAGLFLLTVGLSLLSPILRLLGCTDSMLPYAIPYARFILLGAPINCVTFVLNSTLRGEGRTGIATVGISAGAIANIGLDALFITYLDMGTGGAALATMIGQILSFLILGFFFLTRRNIVRIHPRYLPRSFADYRLIILTGLPTICRQGLSSIAAAVLNIQAISYGGDAAGAAVTVAGKLYTLVRSICFGFGQGFQPVAGYNFGAGKKKRTWQSFTFACFVGTGICIFFTLILYFFARPIMTWFTPDETVVELGVRMVRLSCVVLPTLAVSTYVNHLYQGLGFKAIASFLASCRQGIFFLPAVLILPLFLNTTGVLISQSVADLCTFLVAIPFLIRFYRRHIR